MSRMVTARWQDWSGQGIEHLVLKEGADGIVAESVVLATADGHAFAARYRLACDGDWRLRKAELGLVGGGRTVTLSADGSGNWTDGSGAPLPELQGAIDIDLSVTPFTNTLPIRRLGLREGQAEAIVAVYVQLPDLTIATDPQLYTCLESGRRYRYESLDSDFTREIEVDDDGLVLLYPGLFRRLL